MASDENCVPYHRLEPMIRSRGTGGLLDVALEAGVCDPLFMLGRQWQLAEFHGEDGGSPVSSHLRLSGAEVTRFRPSDTGPPVPLDPRVPLEYMVEGGADEVLPLRASARAGLRLLSQLQSLPEPVRDSVTRELVHDACPLPPVPPVEGVHEPDPAGRALHRAMADRAPDATKLDRYLADGRRPAGLTAAQAQHFKAAAADWRRWFAAEHARPATSSWVRERLEHRFSIGASLSGEQTVLTAPEYTGGAIELYHLDCDSRDGQSLDAPDDATPPVERTTVPTRATYPGMPAERWWEFEDNAVNLPAISAGPVHLARLLVVEFANVYGNDHWVIPVELDTGQIYRITGLTVTDDFGDTTEIGPVHDDAWSMFRPADITTGKPGAPLLPLLTTATARIEGERVEEVLFARDEMANLGWAVERVVQSATGRPRRRGDEIPDDGPPHAPPATGALVYRLLDPVPPHWIPLVPVLLNPDSTAIRFRRGQIPRFATDSLGRPVRQPQIAAVGQLLEPTVPRVYFRDEEIPRSGVTATRVPVVARAHDGAVYRWVGRRVRAGRGELSGVLAFDSALPPQEGP